MKISESPTSFGGPGVAALDRRPFPLRTLMVCFTIWLIATELLIFNQIRFNAKAELLEQAARSLRGSQLIVPSDRTHQLSDQAKMEKL
jgi:hypothetical protein